MRQVLRAGALRPRGMGWGGRWEGDSGWGTHVNPWLIHVNVWQRPLQYYKAVSLQLIKINEKKKRRRICLAMQGTLVLSLVQEDPTCHGATRPVCHNYWASALEPTSHGDWGDTPQLLKPVLLEHVLYRRDHHSKRPESGPHSPKLRPGHIKNKAKEQPQSNT